MMRLAVFAVTILLASCGGMSNHASNGGGGGGSPAPSGTWGHLNGGRSHWLAQLPPNSTVSVCGTGAAEAAVSIRDWAAAVDRDDGLTVNDDCDRQADRVVVISDSSNAAVSKVCKARPEAAGLALVDYGIILLCVADHRSQILLHEIGHLWGLCDVYPLTGGMADNCDPLYFTGRSRDSVMGASYASRLASGDKAGLRRIVARPDVVGNHLWSDDAATVADDGSQMTGPASFSLTDDLPAPSGSDVLTADDVPPGFVDTVTSHLNF